jgi:esterase/lipase superfamily enzyme
VRASLVANLFAALAAVLMLLACASKPYQLMPTPVLYQQPSAVPVITQPREARRGTTDVDLFYITDREPETDPESTLPYGEARATSIAFGSARVKIADGIGWKTLERESRLAQRTRDLNLSLGQVTELGRFPDEPYAVEFRADGGLYRAASDKKAHDRAEQLLRRDLKKRLERSPTKEITLYVHGFNETFATAAFTTAELCHFLGREPVCAFFTWPASSTGNFLTSYSSTTESAQYAEDHLRKVIRLLATTPGVERLQLLAHSRGAGLLLRAVRDLFSEAIAAGREPMNSLRIGNIVLFSPDVDLDIARKDFTFGISDPGMFTVWRQERLPRALGGRLTIYSSPQDRALRVSRLLFRSQSRAGNVRAEDVPMELQRYLAPFKRFDIIVFEGKRTDPHGHFYFTTNPRVSSDLIQLLRYGKKPGEPGRELDQFGPIVWKFPTVAK